MSYLHSNWRDCKAWNNEGLSLSTTSNEAAKMYDALLTQVVSWCDDPSVGGMANSQATMISADPDFVMGHVITNDLALLRCTRSIHSDPQLKSDLDKLYALAAKSDVTQREKLHVSAVKEWAEGNPVNACHIWEDILTDHPTDMLAIMMSFRNYLSLGYQPQMRDSFARVINRWTMNTPLYWNLNGMYAFGLLETNFHEEAEMRALKSLEVNPKDCWSTHTQTHVLEVKDRQDEGIDFLSRTQENWTERSMLAGHIFWHWALYHVEKGEYEAALEIFDQQLGIECKSGGVYDMVNASSLLYRLQMEGVDVGERWKEMSSTLDCHMDDHIRAFIDSHLLMCALGTNNEDATLKFMDSLRKYASEGSGTNCGITREVGLPMCEAFVEAEKGRFDKAVEILKPVRYKVVKLGASDAQRDVFHLFLINAALQSDNPRHHRYARTLLTERKCLRQNSPMTDRLIAKALALHND